MIKSHDNFYEHDINDNIIDIIISDTNTKNNNKLLNSSNIKTPSIDNLSIDDCNKANKINNDKLRELLYLSTSMSLYDIAKVVHFCYKKHYIVGKIKNKLWYVFDGIKWKITEVGPYYRLSSEIVELYERIKQEEENKLNELNDGQQNEVEECMKKINIFNNLIQKLKNVNTKEQICKECLYLFYDPDFMYRLDTNFNLICFENGVLNLETNKFGIGYPDQYLSIMINCDFSFPSNNNEKKELTNIFDLFKTFRLNILKKRKNKLIFNILKKIDISI
jgi:hypothetical protein